MHIINDRPIRVECRSFLFRAISNFQRFIFTVFALAMRQLIRKIHLERIRTCLEMTNSKFNIFFAGDQNASAVAR